MNFNFSKYLISMTLLVAVQVGYTHGEKKHEETDFDPVSEVFGEYDPALKAEKTIQVSMADTMRFTPSSIEVEAGDVVKFVIANEGQLQHEFVLGTPESLQEHSELMIKFPGMEHEDPFMAHVDPGKTMEIIWKFTHTGNFEFGCLLPGHYAAGMKGSVVVNE